MSNENSSGTRRFYGWTIVVSLWIIYFLNVGFPMYGGQTVNTFMADEMGFKRTILGLAFSLFNLPGSARTPDWLYHPEKGREI